MKNTRWEEKWISGTIEAVKGSGTYLVRVPGKDHYFVYANHLIPDNARGMGTPEMVTLERLEYNPPLDFQKTPVIPTLRSQIQSEDNKISR